jgi:hypothetical protein
MSRGAGRVADSVAGQWLDELAATTTHLSLSLGDPASVLNPHTLEPSGLVFARSPVTWARSGRLLRNTNVLSWAGLLANTDITHIVGWNAAFNGAYTFSAPINPLSYEEIASGGLVIAVDDFYVGLDL